MTAIFLVLLGRDMYDVTRWPHDQLALADYRTFMEVASRVLAGGPYYNPSQYAPYPVRGGDVLYPPVTLYLLIPISLIPEPLRSIAWWGFPLVITALVITWHRPAWWAWPVIAACCWWWRTPSQIIHGNIVMWVVAAVALGTVFRWPAVIALVKVSVAPFALVGVNRRSWWVGALALGCLSLPFLGWTLDYPRILGNLRGVGPLYSLPEYPFLGIPLLAWLGQTRVPNDGVFSGVRSSTAVMRVRAWSRHR